MPVLPATTGRCWAEARFAGAGLICGGTDPGRRTNTTLLVSALDGSGQSARVAMVSGLLSGLERLGRAMSRLSESWLALPHADGSHAARAVSAPLDRHVHIPARR